MIADNDRANGSSAEIEQAQFSTSAEVLKRIALLIGTYDPALTAVVENKIESFNDPDAVGAKFGFGFDLHSKAMAFAEQYPGKAFYVGPQAEVTGAAATGQISITGTATEAGPLNAYCAGRPVGAVNVSIGDDGATIAAAVVAQWAKVKRLRTTTVVNGTVNTQIDVTEKSKGLCGNFTSLAFNLGFGEKTPAGLTIAVTAMSGGSGVPDVDGILNALGTGDDQNSLGITDAVQAYGLDTTPLNKISIYDGVAGSNTGNYNGEVAKPFQFIGADVTPGSSGLSALITLGNNRKTDRTNGLIAVPGSYSHPAEIASKVCAERVKIANIRPEESLNKHVLVGVIPGEKTDDWTSSRDNRSSAVDAGISTTISKNGTVYISDLLSFCHPDDVSPTNNIYRSMRNLAVVQNILSNEKAMVDSSKYTGVSIVEDKREVKDATHAAKVLSRNDMIGDLIILIENIGNKAWLYSKSWCKKKLLSNPTYYVQLRADGKGFTMRVPVIFSGEGGILNLTTEADVSLALFQ